MLNNLISVSPIWSRRFLVLSTHFSSLQKTLLQPKIIVNRCSSTSPNMPKTKIVFLTQPKATLNPHIEIHLVLKYLFAYTWNFNVHTDIRTILITWHKILFFGSLTYEICSNKSYIILLSKNHLERSWGRISNKWRYLKWDPMLHWLKNQKHFKENIIRRTNRLRIILISTRIKSKKYHKINKDLM